MIILKFIYLAQCVLLLFLKEILCVCVSVFFFCCHFPASLSLYIIEMASSFTLNSPLFRFDFPIIFFRSITSAIRAIFRVGKCLRI